MKSIQSSNKKLFISVGFVLLFIAGLLFFGKMRSSDMLVSLSGSIDFNGVYPSETPNAETYIHLMKRQRGQNDWVETGVVIPVTDGATWDWHTAIEGTTYELRADGFFGDQFIASSNIVLATAPANGIRMTFNVTNEDLPSELLPTLTSTPQPSITPSISPSQASPTPTQTQNARVSGTVVINGFLPANSFVNFYARRVGSSELEAVRTHVNAVNGMNWEFENAVRGVSYDYITRLYTRQGQLIGESNRLTVTAPAANEVVVINSTAAEPSRPAELSGVVRMQGPFVQNSSVLVLQRTVGQAEFAVIDRYPAQRDVNWRWTGAVTGVTYEVTAALQVNEQNTASSEVITLSAPATNANLVIDTGVNLTSPNQRVSINCGSPDGTNHYNTEISIPLDPSAKSYHLEVGTAAGSNNVFDDRVRPNAVARVFIAGNSPHFARFRMTACNDCNLNDVGNWSGWSPTYGFICQDGKARMIGE